MNYLDILMDQNENYKLLEYEFSQKLYYFGDHFKHPNEVNKKTRAFKNFILNSIHLPIPKFHEKVIQSNTYIGFPGLNQRKDTKVIKPLWQNKLINNPSGSLKRIKTFLYNPDLSYIYREKFSEDYLSIIDFFYNYYDKNIKSVIVPYDLPFFERLTLKIFNDLKRPNAVFLHGLPARYNNIDDNRAEKLFVWGEAIKRNYVNSGNDGASIVVVGHPRYSLLKSKSLKKMKNPKTALVLTKAVAGGKSNSCNFISRVDRNQSLIYLDKIKKALKNFAFNKVVLRPHPSESIDWYSSKIDLDFFTLDKLPLNQSIHNVDIVIGPSSTVLLDSVLAGKNYVVFEPCDQNGNDILGYPIVDPFNDKNSGLIISNTTEELCDTISSEMQIEHDCLFDYVSTSFKSKVVEDYLLCN